MIKKVIGLIILFSIVIILARTVAGIYEEGKIKNYDATQIYMSQIGQDNINDEQENLEKDKTNSSDNNESSNNLNSNSDKSNSKENLSSRENDNSNNKNNNQNSKIVPTTYKGYKVSSQLKIEKLDIDTYVLESSNKNAMEVSVIKCFGSNPNEVGNYCIAGHNYITKNMFSELKKLEVGDEISLTDNKHGTVMYEIYDKYKVVPTQTDILSQETNGEKQITLITCSDYSKKRIIIKAREKID